MTRADSPMYLSTMADATTLRNVALMLDARARARRVFPVPGGPYSSTPLGGFVVVDSVHNMRYRGRRRGW